MPWRLKSNSFQSLHPILPSHDLFQVVIDLEHGWVVISDSYSSGELEEDTYPS